MCGRDMWKMHFPAELSNGRVLRDVARQPMAVSSCTKNTLSQAWHVEASNHGVLTLTPKIIIWPIWPKGVSKGAPTAMGYNPKGTVRALGLAMVNRYLFKAIFQGGFLPALVMGLFDACGVCSCGPLFRVWYIDGIS